jgi:transcription initiation factor TFIIF subunit alpha
MDQQQPVAPPRPRPKKDTGPLRAPRRPLKNITRPMVSLTSMNEARKPAAGASTTNNTREELNKLRQAFLSQGASTFPLIVTRRDLKELRHHVMRLQNKTRVDIQDSQQFQTPIRLHRRDPRAPPSGVGSHIVEEETKEDIEEIKERERIELQKDERRKVREDNQAKIAPTGKTKPQAFQKKTEQKYRPDDTPEAKKRQLLRYEETLPWHLEDFENKQTWVGTYESELSEAHVMLSTDPANPHGPIKMAPMERWYRFNVKGKVKPTGEDLDNVVVKAEPGFFKNLEARAIKRELDHEQSRSRAGLSTRIGGGADDEGRIRSVRTEAGGVVKREADMDDIDFDLNEDFADDEEGLNGLFEGDQEDIKDAEEKLKRDRLAAALWERPDEGKLTEQEEKEREEAEADKEMSKFIKKSLVKREKQFDYLDSDEEISDSEPETEQPQTKEEEKKPGEVAEPAPINKGKKRSGSPMSDASTAKKHKKKHTHSSQGGSLAGSRAGSPAASPKPGVPSAKEIFDALPPEGMNIQSLIAIFKGRVDKTNSKDFIKTVKAVSNFDKAKSWITPLAQMPNLP